MVVPVIALCFWLPASPVSAQKLSIKPAPGGQARIYYGDEPAFGYGPSPQHLLTYLPRGRGNDYRDWLEWAKEHRLNHVRSYPPSAIVDAPAENVFARSEDDSGRFDLERFNPAYFRELRRACEQFKQAGVFVHLQLWQAVTWKKSWSGSYYNPDNNINDDISRDAGPGEFIVTTNPALLEHQKRYVERILEATADLGNVYYDLVNEIGNGTAADVEWVRVMARHMREWARENGQKVLLTVNDEGGKRLADSEAVRAELDIIVKDLGRYDEHVRTRARYNKPTASVRNIDWNYEEQERTYFYGDLNLETNTDPGLQARGRKYWWRMFMAGVQMAGAYADAYRPIDRIPYGYLIESVLGKLGLHDTLLTGRSASYRLNTDTEQAVVHFKTFIDSIDDYDRLAVERVSVDHPAAHVYALKSDRELVLYLESPNGRAGIEYPQVQTKLEVPGWGRGTYQGFFYHPVDGRRRDIAGDGDGAGIRLTIPAFKDDLAIYLSRPEKQ